jgi:RNA polymerase sigma-70 factor (ECF subfamily)
MSYQMTINGAAINTVENEQRTIETSSQTDAEVMAANVALAQAGDEAGFTRLIEMTQHRLYRFCLYLCHNGPMAQDLCQEAYVRALEHITTLKEPSQFYSWLLKTAKNLFLDHAKSPRNKNSVALDDVNEAALGSRGEDRASVLAVRQALGAIRPEERMVILLVDMEGHSYKEAAEVIGITENALRSRLHRAREAFLKVYTEE